MHRWGVVGLAALALLSVALSARHSVRTLSDIHDDYAGLSETQRELSVVGAAGLRSRTWQFVRAHVRPSDRYIIETRPSLGAGFHRYMQTFAGYWLLPSVAVTSREQAGVVVFLRMHGPAGAVCNETPEVVCVLRQGP